MEDVKDKIYNETQEFGRVQFVNKMVELQQENNRLQEKLNEELEIKRNVDFFKEQMEYGVLQSTLTQTAEGVTLKIASKTELQEQKQKELIDKIKSWFEEHKNQTINIEGMLVSETHIYTEILDLIKEYEEK